jgi:uncharacterized membrane protein YeaQ/YmgE (transglycosylase-associated protein family)
MELILWIILGAISGWIASSIMHTQGGLGRDVILGIIGAIVGGFVMGFFGQSGVTGFNVYSIVVAVIGAIIVIWIGRSFRRPI